MNDKEDLNCKDLFVAFLENCQSDTSVKKINVICYENPPKFYLSNKTCINEKIVLYNYFSNPSGWNDTSVGPKTDLSFFLSDPINLSETVFFIDSVSALVHYHGFHATYRNLHLLKKHSKKVICAVHGDLISPGQLEELYFLATAYVKLKIYSSEKNHEEKVCEITCNKPGGKVIKQREIFSVNDDFKVISAVQKSKASNSSNLKRDMESLTTFKLGIHMSEEEKRARDDLILPFVKTNLQNKGGQFISQPLVDDLEDDPDDDLDI